jgi:hypothetical protein
VLTNKVSTPLCFLKVLSHSKNEAVKEGYSGFHQWNFDTNERKEFVITNKFGFVQNVNEIFKDIAEVVSQEEGDLWIQTRLKKY